MELHEGTRKPYPTVVEKFGIGAACLFSCARTSPNINLGFQGSTGVLTDWRRLFEFYIPLRCSLTDIGRNEVYGLPMLFNVLSQTRVRQKNEQRKADTDSFRAHRLFLPTTEYQSPGPTVRE